MRSSRLREARGNRPLVSFIMPCYQAEAYVRESLRSALSQDYDNLEVLVSDDHSSDGTWSILNEEVSAYRGPHRVSIQRNSRNLGIENWNVLWEMAKGQFIVDGHADDVFFPHRTRKLVEAWQRSGASVVSSNCLLIDARGEDLGPMLETPVRTEITREALVEDGWTLPLRGSVLAYDRAVIDCFGPLDPAYSSFASDWIIPFRGAVLRGIHVVETPLLKVRQHEERAGFQLMHSEQGEVAKREARLAQELIQRRYMLHTLAARMKSERDPDLADLHARLVESLSRVAEHWMTARNELHLLRFRPNWEPMRW